MLISVIRTGFCETVIGRPLTLTLSFFGGDGIDLLSLHPYWIARVCTLKLKKDVNTSFDLKPTSL